MSGLSFERIEKKFRLNEEQKNNLLATIYQKMDFDKPCKGNKTYKVINIYFDTINNQTISISVQKPKFKQKLRARKYENKEGCFLEIKKKTDGIVRKRRICLSDKELYDLIFNHIMPEKNEYKDLIILKELAYFMNQYDFKPYSLLIYDRLGFVDKNNKNFRITVDSNIKAKLINEISWEETDDMDYLVPNNEYILEIKNTDNYPLWLVRRLSELKIYTKSFSKIGTYYTSLIRKELN